MPAEDRAISDFPIALQLLNTALVLISNPDGQGGYDSYQATLTEIGRVVLETQYTQDLGNVDVFDAIKNCRVLSGTTTPTSSEGADGQLYVKYSTSGNDTSVVGLYVKLSGAWAEIATGGGGDVGVECTQAQYDYWEGRGELLQDTNYYITDGQSGGGVTIDDTTASASTVYSSNKVNNLLSGKADTSSITASAMYGLNASSGVTNLNGGSIKMSNARMINHNLKIDTAKNPNDKIIQLANASDYPSSNSYLVLISSDGVTYRLTISTTGGVFVTSVVPTGEYLMQGFYVT